MLKMSSSVSKTSKTHTTPIITSGIIYNVRALLGSDVAIKLEKMPQVMRYKENMKTYSDIAVENFFVFLKNRIRT